MEKLKLKALKLGVNELLTKEEMKSINGGTGCKVGPCTGGFCNGGDGIHSPCTCQVPSGWVPDFACAN
jgi:hypothetical protein